MKIVKNSPIPADVKDAATFLSLMASDKEEVVSLLLKTVRFSSIIFEGFGNPYFNGAPSTKETAETIISVIVKGVVSEEEATCFLEKLLGPP